MNKLTIQIEVSEISSLTKVLNFLNDEQISVKLIETKAKMEEPSLFISKSYSYQKEFGKNGLQILDLLSQGFKYEEIAEKAEINIDCVRYYIKKIYRTLGVNNSRDAMRIYLSQIKREAVA